MARVTTRTRAVYLIHYVGFPGPVEELAAFCSSRGIFLIEDCALALFSKLGDRPLGSFGDASIFCLYKTLPLPNGGAVLLKDAGRSVPTARLSPSFASTLAYTALAAFRPLPQAADGEGVGDQPRTLQRIARRVLSPFGLARVGSDRFEPRDLGLGMSHLCHRVIAASDASDIAARRRCNYLELAEGLAGIANVVHPELKEGICPLFFAIHTQYKKVLRERLLARGIETVDLWRYDAPGVRPHEFPEVDDLRRTVLEIPCHQDLSSQDMKRIAAAIRSERAYC
jgi:dTDP-4-amino-4,6-dideoxygalactose transaminase